MGQRPFRSAYIIPQQRANGGKWFVFNNKKFGILIWQVGKILCVWAVLGT
jgi:hypothetical protein